MPRYAKLTTTSQELKGLILSKIESDKFPDCFGKDIDKIDFDFENFTLSGRDFSADIEDTSAYDIRTLPNGLVYCLCSAGGDWEVPVSFILYIDPNNQLRAYIPKNGNVYNTKLKCAYGSDEDDGSSYDLHVDDELAMTLFEADIASRIIVK